MATLKASDRLYQDLARSLLDELASGRYAISTRLPAERDLALRLEVSRPTVREAIIALEVHGLGFNVLLAGGVNLMRDPRNGRTFEHLSEDSLLSGVLVGAAIRDIQRLCRCTGQGRHNALHSGQAQVARAHAEGLIPGIV